MNLLEYGNKPLKYSRYDQGVDMLVLCKFANVLDSRKILLGLLSSLTWAK